MTDSHPAGTAGTGAAETDDTEDAESVEPVEVLVGLAEDGEIDPWDIDIVSVTDAFLDRLDRADLRASGRALFYASVLLRMKSDAMLEPDEPDPEPADQPWERPAESAGPDPFASLETEIDRRLERKRARGTPETLDELVRELREAERGNWWKQSREYDTDDSEPRGPQRVEYRSNEAIVDGTDRTTVEATANTHGEDVGEIVEDVYAAIAEQYDRGRAEVLFREIAGVGGSRVQTFLGVLFLANRGRVRLRQDDLFGDLWIQDPAGPAGTDGAIAD